MPIGSGLSPVLKAVPNLSSSQDETFSILTSSFAAAIQFVGLGQFDQVFDIVPVAQSHRENHLFAFFGSQCLKSGNATRKAGLVHGIHIHPDESADKGGHQQPAILADPFLPFDRPASL